MEGCCIISLSTLPPLATLFWASYGRVDMALVPSLAAGAPAASRLGVAEMVREQPGRGCHFQHGDAHPRLGPLAPQVHELFLAAADADDMGRAVGVGPHRPFRDDRQEYRIRNAKGRHSRLRPPDQLDLVKQLFEVPGE